MGTDEFSLVAQSFVLSDVPAAHTCNKQGDHMMVRKDTSVKKEHYKATKNHINPSEFRLSQSFLLHSKSEDDQLRIVRPDPYASVSLFLRQNSRFRALIDPVALPPSTAHNPPR